MTNIGIRVTPRAKYCLEQIAKNEHTTQIRALERALETYLEQQESKAFWDSMKNRKQEDINESLQELEAWEVSTVWEV